MRSAGLQGVKGLAEMRLMRRGMREKRKKALGFMVNISADAEGIKRERVDSESLNDEGKLK